MRSLLLAATLLASFTAAAVPGGNQVYSLTDPKVPAGYTGCYATGPPSHAGNDQVSLFSVYACNNGKGQNAYIGYTNLDTPKDAKILATSPEVKTISYATPIAIDQMRAVFWSRGDNAQYEVGVVNSGATDGKPVWKDQGTGHTASVPAYSLVHGNVYYALGSLVVAKNMDSGKDVWVEQMNDLEHISSIVYYENFVFWMTQYNKTLVSKLPTISKKPAGSTTYVQTETNACNVDAAPGETLQLAVVKFGDDINGELNGLFIYGNRRQFGSTKTNFFVCRFSHHTITTSEKNWNFASDYFVEGITGGDNATFWNVYNKNTNDYEVLVINQTTQETYIIKRAGMDKMNNPMVVYPPAGETKQPSPVLVMQNSNVGARVGMTVAYETQPTTGKFPNVIAWQKSWGCESTATVVSASGTDRLFCVDGATGVVTSADYLGEEIWQQSGIQSAYSAVNIDNVYVIFQMAFGVVAYGFDPQLSTPAPGNQKAGGPSGGIIALIIIIILFIIGLGIVLFKVWTQQTKRRTASRMQLDKEGYAGLNA